MIDRNRHAMPPHVARSDEERGFAQRLRLDRWPPETLRDRTVALNAAAPMRAPQNRHE
jgi:hypothetical protein